MNKLHPATISALQLLLRSPRDANGWAACSEPIMAHIIPTLPDDLVEKDYENLRIRLTERGKVVADYI